MVISDEFYKDIRNVLKSMVPEFHFDETDEVYLIMFEFSQFLIENINHDNVFLKCCLFIDEAIAAGKSETEDVIVLQVFQSLYYSEHHIDRCRRCFAAKTLIVFEKYLVEFLKDYKQGNISN